MFPDVTVCNLNPLWHNAPDWGQGLQATVHGIDKPLSYEEYIMMVVDEMFTNSYSDADQQLLLNMRSMAGFMKHVGRLKESMIESLKDLLIWRCRWHGVDDPQGSDCMDVIPIITPEFGLCYTIKPPLSLFNKSTQDIKGLIVTMHLNNPEDR